jgi:hypothetical protein
MRIFNTGAILAFFVASQLFGCATVRELSPGEKAYIQKLNATPSVFSVERSKGDDAWGRAQSFLGRFSSMKLQIATDFVIQTYNPTESEVDYGYSVTKTPIGNNFEFQVRCSCGNMFGGAEARKNARILSYYILTGELPYPRMIAR